jgi:N6-adenosine-specific RNA methylase IME4
MPRAETQAALRGLVNETEQHKPKRSKVEIIAPSVGKGNAMTREQWAGRLNGEWEATKDNAVEGFFELGQSLLLCRGQIKGGEWLDMVTNDLHFNQNVTNKLMRIGKWQNRRNATLLPIMGKFPPDYTTLDILSRLHEKFPEVFDRLLDDGTICPSLQRNEISKILRLERVAEDEQRILNLAPIAGKFRTLVFDPAWEYDWLSLAGRAKPGYAMQSLDQLRALDIKQWADQEVGCHLYVWTTNNFMVEACKLIVHWGFQYRTAITWVKPPPFGLGSYFRNSTEHVLFATLGDTTTRPAAASMATDFRAPRGEHSEKPECFYDIVRAASYPPYGEGNQREPRPDFTNLFEEVAITEAAE